MAVMTKAALYSRIDSMRKKYGIESLFDPPTFAKANGYRIAPHNFDDTNVRGFLLRVPGTPYKGIAVSERLTHEEQRCVIAHELVHSELHGAWSRIYDSDTEQGFYKEYQADEGAAELMLPYRDFIPRVYAMRGLLNFKPSLAVARLATYYGVDCEYIRKRIKSLAYEVYQYANGVPLSEIQLASIKSQDKRGLKTQQFIRKGIMPKSYNADVWADENQ